MNFAKKFETCARTVGLPINRQAGTLENAQWYLKTGIAKCQSHQQVCLLIFYAQRLVKSFIDTAV